MEFSDQDKQAIADLDNFLNKPNIIAILAFAIVVGLQVIPFVIYGELREVLSIIATISFSVILGIHIGYLERYKYLNILGKVVKEQPYLFTGTGELPPKRLPLKKSVRVAMLLGALVAGFMGWWLMK